MLEIVSGDRGRGINFAEKWSKSPERDAIRKQIDQLVDERKGRPENQTAAANSEFSAAPWTQVVEVTKRQLRDTWRDAPFAYGILFSNVSYSQAIAFLPIFEINFFQLRGH